MKKERYTLWTILIALALTMLLFGATRNFVFSMVAGAFAYFAFYIFFEWVKQSIQKETEKAEAAEAKAKMENRPKVLRKELSKLTEELEDLLGKMQKGKALDNLSGIHKTLCHILDFLECEPNKAVKFARAVEYYLPELFRATILFAKKSKYGFYNEENEEGKRFVEFTQKMDSGLKEMFMQVMEQEELGVSIDMETAVKILVQNGILASNITIPKAGQ